MAAFGCRIGAHDRREGHRHDAGHDHGGGESEGEFLEQHAGEARQQADRGIDGRKRDRHRDDGCEELPGADQGGLGAAHSVAHVARDIFYDDDGIVDDEADGEHNRQQGEKVQ